MISPLPCILCGSGRFRITFVKKQWHYLECLDCGLVRLHPRPSQPALMESYEAYLPIDASAIKQWHTLIKPVIDVSADLVTACCGPSGRLLDVGCGFGFFMERMHRTGWSVEGLEVSPIGRRYATQNWGFDVYAQPFEDMAFEENRYDAVTLFYVIEHVSDPVKVLKKVRRILKPDGLVLLRWPHTTPIVRLAGPLAKRLDLYHTPYHLYDFSPATMAAALERAGFGAVQTSIGGHTHPSHRLGRLVTSTCGALAQIFFAFSKGRWLLPGVSKTTIARA